jgi:hypothetical protein
VYWHKQIAHALLHDCMLVHGAKKNIGHAADQKSEMCTGTN